MTPGQEALAEAARAEAARVYGQVCRETKALAAPLSDWLPQARRERLLDVIDLGWSNSRILAEFDLDYPAIQAARKEAMRRLAS